MAFQRERKPCGKHLIIAICTVHLSTLIRSLTFRHIIVQYYSRYKYLKLRTYNLYIIFVTDMADRLDYGYIMNHAR